MHIIDSIITNNANPQAQKFALKNDSFNCYIFINDKLISINSKEINLKEVTYREYDKVLQLVNDPDNNIFNGDIGVIKNIEYKGKSGSTEITIDYYGNLVTYKQKEFNKFKHGYIISIHKSQGSEFELVIMPISSSYKRMLYKKLIYTGITRAKKSLTLVGEKSAFIYGTSRIEEECRNTLLCDLLKTSIKF